MTDRTAALEQALKDIQADILKVAEAHYAVTRLTDPQSPAAVVLLASLYGQMTELSTRIDDRISEAFKHA